jgi:antitoxin (DNA-binding transcriptional repressor) of toxin-antitoxin stability system
MTVTLQEAQTHLRELIEQMPLHEEMVISDQGQPVAKLSRVEKKTWPCQPGSAKDIPHWMAPDFNAPLDDFREYME